MTYQVDIRELVLCVRTIEVEACGIVEAKRMAKGRKGKIVHEQFEQTESFEGFGDVCDENGNVVCDDDEGEE